FSFRVFRNRRRQQPGGDERCRADGQVTVRLRRRAADVHGRGLEVEQTSIGDRQELHAELGERHTPRGAVEQPEAELRLELAHQNAHSRLRDEQLLGGAREALMLRGEKESFELDRKSTRLNSSHVKISYAV